VTTQMVGHPRYTGPVIDAHAHFDAGARACAAAVLAKGDGLPDAVVNFWDLRWPPQAFAGWADTWQEERTHGMALLHMPDLSRVGAPGFEEELVLGVHAAAARGAAGLKVWKNLGLTLRDVRGARLAVDEPRLGALWAAAAEVGLPVAIHVGDPPGFFAPIEPANERYEELRIHPEYWFGDRTRFPPLAQIHEELERLVAAHRHTTFVALHFGCFMPLADVDRMLAAYENLSLDTATRTFDLGRTAYREETMRIFARWPERILFGTDLIRTGVYDLPVAEGATPREDARAYYDHHWRFFESEDDDIPAPFAFLPSDWRLTGLGLDEHQLRLLYHDNARRLYRLADVGGCRPDGSR
jgi:hypothetical protein